MSACETLLQQRRSALQQAHALRPHMNIERALHFTTYFREHEHEPLIQRWSGAMCRVMDRMEIHVLPHEMLLGRMGPEGRYGIFYPELEGTYLLESERALENELAQLYRISPEDIDTLRGEILPYWQEKTMRERLAAALPPDLKNLFYQDGQAYNPSFILHETATIRHSLQWALPYEKILQQGFMGIVAQAEAALGTVAQGSPQEVFFSAILALCHAVRRLAGRYEACARQLATQCHGEQARHYARMAELCAHVPWQPARTFHEAVQAQWFTQLISRIEQLHGGMISNGRMDQFLLPYYRQDMEEGRLTSQAAQEILESLWGNISQCVRIQTSPAASKIYENNAAHWEHVTIGGVTADGSDAANELSTLLFRSAQHFPWPYPLFCVRVHAHSDEKLLALATALAARGQVALSFINDEEVIPLLTRRGAPLCEARDYSTAGCAEARLLQRHTYFSGSTWLNLGAALEMALYDGFCCQSTRRMGIPTGDATRFTCFEDFWAAFQAQVQHLQIQIFRQQGIMESLRAQMVAAPLLSCLHDLCMAQGRDINDAALHGGIDVGGQTSPVGFASVVDSLAALRELVYVRKSISLHDFITVLRNNFQGHEILRRQCLTLPKYGIGNAEVDALGQRLEQCMADMCLRHRNMYGGQGELLYVPVTGHVAMGRVTGALPDGRLAGDRFSEGVTPVLGQDKEGPTALLESARNTMARRHPARTTRMLTVHLRSEDVQDAAAPHKLAALLRVWCQQGHWHLAFRVYNASLIMTVENSFAPNAQYFIRPIGYSTYFSAVDTAQLLE